VISGQQREVRGQMSEIRKTEDGGQKSEVRRQISESTGQKADKE
jgi:hypothetical protein